MSHTTSSKGNWGLALAPDPDPLDPSAAQRLDQIKAPTLIIAGELDNPEILRAADVMAAAIPNTQKVIIPNAAHLPNMEQSGRISGLSKTSCRVLRHEDSR